MEIKPDREKFDRLCLTSKRVPLSGEAIVPNLNPSLLFGELFGQSPYSFIYESGKGPGVTSRYSFLGESTNRFLKIQNGKVFLSDPDGQFIEESDNPLYGIDCLNFETGVESVDYLPHFWGGWVGYIGYEATEWFEVLPSHKEIQPDLPELFFMCVERLIVYDHKTSVLKYILSHPIPDDEMVYDTRTNQIREFWNRIYSVTNKAVENKTPRVTPSPDSVHVPLANLNSTLSREDYMRCVRKALEYIAEGDIYQANIAQRYEMECHQNPFDLYLRLREVNPSPFSGYMKFGDFVIVSSSPERLVKLEEGRLQTRPIAGTRPRGKNPEDDRLLATELMLNEKEKAEHLMLVDLERNDLGRICETGSVTVNEFMILEQYSHVSHIVSNVEGRVKSGTSVKDILKAVFPGGTITGCPKIRCMEIIHELEPSGRGPYTGSFGYIGFSPIMDLNIIIRTIICKNDKSYFHVGAGIVADSDPEQEYQETLDKAAAMILVLNSNGFCHD